MTQRRQFLGFCGGLGLGLTLRPLPAFAAAPDQDDFAELNNALLDQCLLPRYEALAVAGESLEGALRRDCADGGLGGAEESKKAFHAMMDAWMAAQHLRFGPSELFLRADRMQFWPDKRGVTGRRLSQLLANPDPAALEPQRFAQGSVAIQGLPALERLLFDMPEAAEQPFACDLAVRIGENLKEISADLLADWRDGPSAYAAVLRNARQGNAEFLDAKEASLQLAKSLRSALLIVVDFKLQRVLGEAVRNAKPKRAESWRSGRSLRNIEINLEAAQALYQNGGQGGFSALLRRQPDGPTLHVEIEAVFRRTRKKLANLPASMTEALEEEGGWQRLSTVRDDVSQLLALISGPFSQMLDLPLGFNSFDGD
ncbi:imelysin family protein [Pelagibius sp.]|uniref:imelysin family protein n=1 Tax=Pelagibius sp. TaxID=1931238 RepID=UPI003BAE8721